MLVGWHEDSCNCQWSNHAYLATHCDAHINGLVLKKILLLHFAKLIYYRELLILYCEYLH